MALPELNFKVGMERAFKEMIRIKDDGYEISGMAGRIYKDIFVEYSSEGEMYSRPIARDPGDGLLGKFIYGGWRIRLVGEGGGESLIWIRGSRTEKGLYRTLIDSRFADEADVLESILSRLSGLGRSAADIGNRTERFLVDRAVFEPHEAWDVIFNEGENGVGFLQLVTKLRLSYPHTLAGGDPRPPLRYAVDEGVAFRIGPNLWVTPISGSFRRHIVFAKREDRGILFAFEVIVPGQLPEKRNTFAERRRSVALDILRTFPESDSCVRPLFEKELPQGDYKMYGGVYNFGNDTPLRVIAFDYLHDGKRLDMCSAGALKLMADEAGVAEDHLRRSVLQQMAELTAIVHASGYAGHSATDDKETDTEYHMGNFRISADTDGVRVRLVADFPGFKRLDEFADPESEIEEDYKSIVEDEYGMAGLSSLLKIPAQEIYSLFRLELARARQEVPVNMQSASRGSFSRWLFEPGMNYGDVDYWWNSGRRASPHEGVDLYKYECRDGSVKNVEPGTAVNAASAGVVVNITEDFMGKTVWLRHDIADGGTEHVYSAYGHIKPLDSIVMGSVINESDMIGT
ncbi:MAG TPA: hypothetical protein PLV52_05960, partial [Candidatus Omnitrophota bacterium]|nr:hypothetical protein [Candidatus Omnitrophota bacterium]